jgi:hypothetical protein
MRRKPEQTVRQSAGDTVRAERAMQSDRIDSPRHSEAGGSRAPLDVTAAQAGEPAAHERCFQAIAVRLHVAEDTLDPER